MPANELLPGRGLTPFRSRCDVVAAQYVAHSLVRDVIAEVRQRANDPVVTPAVFSRAMRTMRASIAASIRGRPGYERRLDSSNFWAINLRYQARMVSGLATW